MIDIENEGADISSDKASLQGPLVLLQLRARLLGNPFGNWSELSPVSLHTRGSQRILALS